MYGSELQTIYVKAVFDIFSKLKVTFLLKNYGFM